MISKASGWVLAAGLLCSPAHAAPGAAQRLVDECRLKTVYCEGFLSGVIETAALSGQYLLMVSGARWMCMPEDLSHKQVRGFLLAYHQARPKDVVYTPGVYVMNVLEANFPCTP